MAPFLKSLLGNGIKSEELSEELRSILAEMQRERAAFENLVSRSEAAGGRLEELAKPIADAQNTVGEVTGRLGEIQTQMRAVETLVPQIAAAQDQVENLGKAQRRTETQVSHASGDMERVKLQVDEVSAALQEALQLRERLSEFLELGGPLKSLRDDADDLTTRVSGLSGELTRASSRSEELERAQGEARARMESFEQVYKKVETGVEGTAERVAQLETSMEDLAEIAAGASDTKRQLGTLRALTDYVGQKVSALEQQKESVDRATRQAQHLSELMRKIDVQVQKHQESANTIGEMQTRVDELKSLHTRVLERSEEISRQQDQIDREDKATRDTLGVLRGEVQKAVERFEMEKRGLDSVSQRIVDLRGSLAGFEERFHALSESTETINEIHSKAEALTVQADEFAEEIDRLEEQASKVRAVRADVERLDHSVGGVTKRVGTIEESQPAVQEALRDLANLSRSHEAIRDTLEQVRVAESEMTRVRDSQTETETWLANVQESMGLLRGRVKEVQGMKPSVDLVRNEVDRVTQAIGSVESRREFLEEMHKRLGELASVGSQLDERSKGLQARMEAADERFVSLSLHADDASRVEKLVPSILKGVEDAEARVAEVTENIGSLEGRAQNIEALSDRMRRMGEELEQRQTALDKATEHLDRASEIRQEAAATAQELSEHTRKLSTALGSAENRAARLDDLSEQLEDRSSNLRFTEKRLGQFEEKLAKWELVDGQLNRALEQITERQGTVDALQADIKHMFEMAERTVEDVRSIAAAHQEIVQARAALDEALTRMRDVDETIDELDVRKRQIERVEERLARADALVIDIQSSMETLHGQKAFLDHVIEKAGSLTFQAKQAEALIDTLREERELTNRVRAAVSQMREQNLKAG